MSKNLDAVNPGPFGSFVTNFAAVRKSTGADLDAAGVKDFTAPKAEEIAGSTMFGEGSIGKVRYAGLAYMLDQEGVINLQQNAREFFLQPAVGEFLERKYEGRKEELQSGIANLFSGDAAAATLADLTTHRSGIGDLTKDQAKLIEEKGVDFEFSAPDLLLIPEGSRAIPRSANGRPKFQTHPDMPDAKYGAHQYSNLGYIVLGLAMEAAYDAAKNPDGVNPIKDYKQLTRDYLLHPIEGPAAGKGLAFDETKFPEEIDPASDVARVAWVQDGKFADATKFSGANAAGGMFASADDSTKFFEEFFRGFPGSPEYGEEGANKFFSSETILLMMQEGEKFGNCGLNGGQADPTRKGNERFQAPGFAVEIDQKTNIPLAFEKSGGTFGYQSFLSFDPRVGKATIDMCAQENATSEALAAIRGEEFSELTVPDKIAAVKDFIAERRDPASKEFDRKAVIGESMPGLLSTRSGGVTAAAAMSDEVLDALSGLKAALERNGAGVLDSAGTGHGVTEAAPHKESAGASK